MNRFSTSALPVALTTRLQALIGGIQHICDTAPATRIPHEVCRLLESNIDCDALLTKAQQQGSSAQYTRHVMYAHPRGRFTIVALVWNPGQYTPVHGHFTWCSYAVMTGVLLEEQFTWDRATGKATQVGSEKRPAGTVVGGHAGMDAVHRLRNTSEHVAISVHVYGVEGERIATHVNRIAELIT
ncbi:cysteine dioxygenase family protein [Pandoraea anhela]|uniref:cysteine dioxygenase family protein n=1 Tax=Pandoraea anhela TaxID=2508295 RepID=UPI001582B8CD|nr:cysteine dioxygenase family protein [Pandoraea anhela]